MVWLAGVLMVAAVVESAIPGFLCVALQAAQLTYHVLLGLH
jgi:hypothetical protein